MSLLNQYSKDELTHIVSISNSWKNLAKNLGYNCNSSDLKSQLQKRVLELEIDVSHFKSVRSGQVERTEDNVFVKNSTASQNTLRMWYKKGNYTEYKCSICGQEPFWNGKEMTLILDHIDGDNTNDELSNLRWVCPNCNIQLPTTNRRKNKLKKKNYCVDCGEEISSQAQRCIRCSSQQSVIPLEQMKITRDELKGLIRTTNFVQIGILFDVSDNTVRKWCKKFNLPISSREIKQYSDQEWEVI